MTVTFPQLRVGEPVSHEALSVFPLFSEADGRVEYVLSDEAIAAGSVVVEEVVVEEVSEGGSVPDLLVENRGESRVLFLEGEELVGAKQNRILNTSVLVAGRSKTQIPVSCVERGRWSYKTKHFGSSGSHSPSKLRLALKSSVSRSVKEKRGHSSDQGEVWKQVASMHASHGVSSDTGAMSDAFDAYKERLDEFRERLRYVEGATGVAVALRGQVVAVDVFDKPATCRKVWDRLLSGLVLDALEAGPSDGRAEIADVERLVLTAGDLPWEPAEPVGEGEEYRAESPQGDHASLLTCQGAVVHGSVVAAV